MIAAIQLLEYLHYHITLKIYVTLYNVNTYKDILCARKQADKSTKNETKQICSQQHIPVCTIKGPFTELFL